MQNKKEKENTTYEKPKTKEEIQNERLSNITTVSNSVEQLKITSSVKKQLDGEGKITQTEIELDKSRGISSEIKKEKLSEVEKKSGEITEDIAKRFSEIDKNLAENDEIKATKSEEDENVNVG